MTRKLAAWGVHLFTASGIVLALLALAAAIDGRPGEALLWLFVALVVDGLDGMLARAARVKEQLPRIDGDALDLVIDYITYVLIPALMIWRMEVLPAGWGLPLAAAISVTSLYVFARRDMKTDDGYFRGFPGLWNIVAFYFYVAPPDPVLGGAIVIALVIMTFAPVHVVHPFRVRDFGIWLPAIAVLWAIATVGLLLQDASTALSNLLLTVSLVTATALMAMGLWRTVRGPASR